jgi:hypothetical protein
MLVSDWPTCFWFSQNEMKIALYKTFPTALLQSLAPTFTVPSFRQKIFQKCYPITRISLLGQLQPK